MKTINVKDMLVIGGILVIIYCLLRRPIMEKLEGDKKEIKQSCPEGCSSLTQISINQGHIDKLTRQMNDLQKELTSSKDKITTLETKINEAEEEARKQSDGMENIKI